MSRTVRTPVNDEIPPALVDMEAGRLPIEVSRLIARSIVREMPGLVPDLFAALRGLTGRALRTPDVDAGTLRRLHQLLAAVRANVQEPDKTGLGVLADLVYETVGLIETGNRTLRLPLDAGLRAATPEPRPEKTA